jgi:hypothetical protein
MNDMLTDSRVATVNREEWESTLRRLDAIADQINRALHRSTSIEEPKNAVRRIKSQKMIDHGKISSPLLITIGREFQSR